MLKLIIADDEYLVVEGIKSMVDWEMLGIQLVGEIYDGISALKMIQKKQPDIIMTDIRMPGINGLQLIEKVKIFAPEIVFIVFSGYNEFEYAKKAISLGVVDYIDKPVTVAKIEETLNRAKKMIDYRQEHNVMKKYFLENEKILLENVIHHLLKGECIEYNKIVESFKNCGVNVMSIKEVLVGVILCDSASDNEFREVIKIIEENCIKERCECFFIRNHQHLVVVIFGLSQQINDPFGRFQVDAEENENRFYIGLGRKYLSIFDLRQSYLEGLKALKYACFIEGEKLVHIDNVEENYYLPSMLNSSQDSIVYSIRVGDKKDVLKQVIEFLNLLKQFKLKPDLFYHECLQLMYLGFKAAQETGRNFVSDQGENFNPHHDMLNCKTFDEISKWLLNMFERLIDWVLMIRNSSNHKSIIIIQEYLDENFAKEITLNELAAMVNMSPTYLSMLFKSEIGISYVKYLTNVRMEKAKCFLNKGYKVKEVSIMVGYYNYRHFSSLFKKKFGMNPEKFK